MAKSKNTEEFLLELKRRRNSGNFFQPISKKFHNPIQCNCPHCNSTFSADSATLFYWQDRSPENCGWVVNCTTCGSRIQVQMAEEILSDDIKEDIENDTGKKDKKFPIWLLILLVLMFAVVGLAWGLKQCSAPERVSWSDVTPTPEPENNNDSDVDDVTPVVPGDTESEDPASEETDVAENVADKHYYKVFMDDVSWEEARIACEESTYDGLQGHLATITSQDEYDEIIALLEEYIANSNDELYYVWLGAENNSGYLSGHNEFAWITGESWDFSKWCNTTTSSGTVINEPSYIDHDNGDTPETCLCLWAFNKDRLGWTFNDQNNDLPTIYPSSQGRIGYICEYEPD